MILLAGLTSRRKGSIQGEENTSLVKKLSSFLQVPTNENNSLQEMLSQSVVQKSIATKAESKVSPPAKEEADVEVPKSLKEGLESKNCGRRSWKNGLRELEKKRIREEILAEERVLAAGVRRECMMERDMRGMQSGGEFPSSSFMLGHLDSYHDRFQPRILHGQPYAPTDTRTAMPFHEDYGGSRRQPGDILSLVDRRTSMPLQEYDVSRMNIWAWRRPRVLRLRRSPLLSQKFVSCGNKPSSGSSKTLPRINRHVVAHSPDPASLIAMSLPIPSLETATRIRRSRDKVPGALGRSKMISSPNLGHERLSTILTLLDFDLLNFDLLDLALLVFDLPKFAGRERLDQIQKLFDTHHDLFSWENLEMVKVQHTQTFSDCSLERHAQSSGSELSSTMENELRTCLKELLIGDFLTINDVALADPILSKSKMAAAIVLESRDNKEVAVKIVKTALSLKNESYAILLISDGKLAREDIDKVQSSLYSCEIKFASSPPEPFPAEEGPTKEEPFPLEEGLREEELDQLAPPVEEEPFPPEEAPAITSCSHRKKPHPQFCSNGCHRVRKS
ncbi:hypothetical protein L1887_28192 [Cichorium endivia]|nr:hypothetical protein L1887_28192 [Cichorium endivia]